MRATDRNTPLALPGALVLAALFLGAVTSRAQTTDPQAKGPLVADVIVQGNRLIPTEQITARLKTRPGGVYTPEVVQEDIRTLYGTRQFANIEAAFQNLSDGRVNVYFLIRDNHTVIEDVVYNGAKHLKQEDLDRLSGLRKGMPLNPSANKRACLAIVQKLNEDGRPFASCDLLSGALAEDTKVVFNITEGPKVGLRGSKFSGNVWASSGRLETQIQSKNILWLFPGKYNPQMIQADIGKLEEYYRSFGFLDIHVARELELTPDGRDVYVIYHIHEGQRYTMAGTPQITGVKSVPIEEVQQHSKLKPGDFYSQTEIDATKKKIEDMIGYHGIEAKVQAIPVFDRNAPNVVRLVYEVEERPPARVGRIFVVGNTRTKQNVILRQVPLFPGQILTYPDMRVGERNLQRLGIFENGQEQGGKEGGAKPAISVINPDDPSPTKDILVQIQEANTGSLMFGVGVNSNSGLTGSIVLNEANFDILKPPTSFDELLSGNAWRGAGQEFRIEAMPGTQIQRYTASWREPFLFDTPISLGDSAYYYTRAYNEYNEERIGGRVTIGRKITPEWTISGTVRVEGIDVLDVLPFAPPDYLNAAGSNFLTGFRIGASYDTRDSYLRPTEGMIVNMGFEECVGNYTFPLANLEVNKFFTLWQRADGSGRQVLALRSQVGWAGSNTPVFERYFAGGFNSIRGFQFRGVGPDSSSVPTDSPGFKLGGDFLFLNSIEYQLPVLANDMIYLVAFVDSGTVESRVQITDYRVAAGFGIRLVVPMMGPMPIALDFGFPIVKGPFDNDQVFSFSMGWTH